MNTPFRFLAGAVALALASCALAPEPASGDLVAPSFETGAAAAGDAIAAAMAADQIPALSVAVMKDGVLVWSAAFGDSDLENATPATRDTKYRLASVSKLFAADLAAMMAAEGVVDLDADIRTYLPAFPDKGAKITLRQLLGHIAGIRHYTAKDFDFAQAGGIIDTRLYPDAASILAIFANDPLVSPPGAEYHYSTFGYSLVSLVLEAASGKSFTELLDEKLLRPAGLADIVVDDSFALIKDRAEFYDPASRYEQILNPANYGPVVNAPPLNSAYKIAGGGLAGDAEAVAAFGELHRAPGFLAAPLWQEIFTPQKLTNGETISHGLGWRIEEDANGRRIFQHSGSQQGARAHLLVYPDDGVVVAFLTNMGGLPADSAALAQAIGEQFLGR
ncbi:MAG: serine hydrolase domain-containing protein [Parvularculaceae bacterium]